MKKQESFVVEINGQPDTLTKVRGYQYNTNGNKSAHRLPIQLKPGMRFRTGGNHYSIIRKIEA